MTTLLTKNEIPGWNPTNPIPNKFGIYSNIGVTYEQEDIKDILIKANLNWNIVLDDVVYRHGEELIPCDKEKMIVREDNPTINFGTCSRWTPIQNEIVVDTLIQFCNKSNGEATLERIGSLQQGKTIWAIADIHKTFELPGGDTVKGYILLTNSHKCGSALAINLLTWREVCTNGMTVKVQLGSKVLAHSASLNSRRIDEILSLASNGFNKFEQDAITLSSNTISLDTAYSFIINQFGDTNKMDFSHPSLSDLKEQPKVVREIVALYLGEAKGADLLSSYNTSWGLLQSCTEYLNHKSVQRGGYDSHINSLWLSSKANKQKQVYQQLVSLALV